MDPPGKGGRGELYEKSVPPIFEGMHQTRRNPGVIKGGDGPDAAMEDTIGRRPQIGEAFAT